jgi:hypothetical protein
MTTKEAKDLLISFKKHVRVESYKAAIDVAIQCLEDSIEGFKLMEAVDEVGKKLEIKRTCRHPKNKIWVYNGETFCDACNQYLI